MGDQVAARRGGSPGLLPTLLPRTGCKSQSKVDPVGAAGASVASLGWVPPAALDAAYVRNCSPTCSLGRFGRAGSAWSADEEDARLRSGLATWRCSVRWSTGHPTLSARDRQALVTLADLTILFTGRTRAVQVDPDGRRLDLVHVLERAKPC